MNLEDIMLSEISQILKDKYCMLLLIKIYRVGQFIKTESRIVVTQGWGNGEQELLLDVYRVSFWGIEKVLETESGDGCTIL